MCACSLVSSSHVHIWCETAFKSSSKNRGRIFRLSLHLPGWYSTVVFTFLRLANSLSNPLLPPGVGRRLHPFPVFPLLRRRYVTSVFFLVIFNYCCHSPLTGQPTTCALTWLTVDSLFCFLLFSLFLPQKLASFSLSNLDLPYHVTLRIHSWSYICLLMIKLCCRVYLRNGWNALSKRETGRQTETDRQAGRQKIRQRRRTQIQDCYIRHHMYLTHVMILYLEPHLELLLLGQRGPGRLLSLWALADYSPNLPASISWPPVQVGLKLCVYIIFITPTLFPSGYQPTWFISAIPLFTQVEHHVKKSTTNILSKFDMKQLF